MNIRLLVKAVCFMYAGITSVIVSVVTKYVVVCYEYKWHRVGTSI